jgi:hypothetical protein
MCTRCAAEGIERRAAIEVLQDYFDIAKAGEHLCHEIHSAQVRRAGDELLSRLDPAVAKPEPASPCISCGTSTDRYNGQQVPRGWASNLYIRADSPAGLWRSNQCQR